MDRSSWYGRRVQVESEIPDIRLHRLVDPATGRENKTYPIASIEFDGVTIRILVSDREYGEIELSGLARESFMTITISGLYGRAAKIRFVRPDAWTGSLERLRSGMEP